MQKHGLTMFASACYSSLVPRVHPGLLCAASISVELRRKLCGGATEKCVSGYNLFGDFLAETFLRCLPPYCGRICRARLTKRSAPGVWPGATVGGESLRESRISLARF